MKIGKNKVVTLIYEVEAEGKIVDRMTEERPLDYIQGTNMLLPRFEQEVEGQEAGFEFSFSATPDEAYGEYDEKKVVEIPKSAFVVDGKLHEEVLGLGNFIPMLNGEGEVVHGKVIEIKDSSVRMDFNHPMADKTLNFKGKVLDVREASEKELKEGLHGEYLPHEGCCHGGCHGGYHSGDDNCACHEDGQGCSCHSEGGDCDCHAEEQSCGCHEDDTNCGCHRQ